MEIAQCNGRITTPWQALPAVPPELQRYADLLARFPCLDVLMVGTASHCVFMRGAGRPSEQHCSAQDMARECKDVVLADEGLGASTVLQAWDDGWGTPLARLMRVPPLVTVTVLPAGDQRRVTTSVRR